MVTTPIAHEKIPKDPPAELIGSIEVAIGKVWCHGAGRHGVLAPRPTTRVRLPPDAVCVSAQTEAIPAWQCPEGEVSSTENDRRNIMVPNDLIRLTPRDVSTAAGVLSRAFFDDPNFRGLIYDDDKRKRTLPRLMEYIVREGLVFGESYATSSQLEGIAVWHRPNVRVSMFSRIFRVGICRAPIDFGVALTRKLLKCGNFLDDMRAKYAPPSHWHLQLLGVNPAYQRKGHAKRLLMPILDQCDQDELSCFLDTQNSVNVPIYERFGFSVVHQCLLPPANVDSWFLLRKPRT